MPSGLPEGRRTDHACQPCFDRLSTGLTCVTGLSVWHDTPCADGRPRWQRGTSGATLGTTPGALVNAEHFAQRRCVSRGSPDPRGAQPRQTIAVDRALPGQELVHGQRVTLARFLQAQQTATDCGHYLRLAPYDPALSI